VERIEMDDAESKKIVAALTDEAGRQVHKAE
jgi:hypothetical protein